MIMMCAPGVPASINHGSPRFDFVEGRQIVLGAGTRFRTTLGRGLDGQLTDIRRVGREIPDAALELIGAGLLGDAHAAIDGHAAVRLQSSGGQPHFPRASGLLKGAAKPERTVQGRCREFTADLFELDRLHPGRVQHPHLAIVNAD